MVSRVLWVWLTVGWLVETVTSTKAIPLCSQEMCDCSRGKVLCDCSHSTVQNITLKRKLLDDTTSSIIIANCKQVHVTSQALSGLPALQQISFNNITIVTLEERSFNWTTTNPRHNGLSINITECGVQSVPSYCFRGSIKDILFTDVNVSSVQAFAFSAINHAERIEFTSVHFGEVESQAFKRFGVDFFKFSESDISVFPTRSVINIDIYREMRLENNKVGWIQKGAFKIQESKSLKITRSMIEHIDNTAFHVIMKGDVFVDDNIILMLDEEAFAGINLDQRYLRDAGKQDFVFENNTLTNVESAALTFNTSGFGIRLDWITINQQCSCEIAEFLANELLFFYQQNIIKTSPSSVNSVVYCLNPKPTSIKDYQQRNCEVTTFSLVLKIIIGCVLIVALCAIVIVIYCKFKKKGKRYINAPTSPSAMKAADFSKAQMLVVPEGKTYRETELHVIFDNIEPIVSTEYVPGLPDSSEHE